MYKYSRTAQERFFDLPTYAFLFASFATSAKAKAFSENKFAENPDARYPKRMALEISQLGQEAFKHLRNSARDEGARTLEKYLIGRNNRANTDMQ